MTAERPSPPDVITAIPLIFGSYLNQNYESVSIPEDPLQEVVIIKEPDKDIWKNLQIHVEERIAILNFQHFICHLPNITTKERTPMEIIENIFFSEWVEEGLKWLSATFNDWEIINQKYDVKHKPFEIRLSEFSNKKRITELSYKMKNYMVSIKGNIVSRNREVINFPIEKQWECAECGTIKIQTIENMEKEPKTFLIPCSTFIQDPSGKAQPFYCKSKNYVDKGVTKWKPVMIFKIEALSSETSAQRNDPQVFQINLSDNLTSERYLDDIQENKEYEFVGLVKMREVKKSTESTFYTLYLEVQSYKLITENKTILVTEEERKQIKEFLERPNSLAEASKLLGQRVVGFEKEKKVALIMKMLQMQFNTIRTQHTNPRDYLLHMLVCGDYGRGKSELVETFEDICEKPYYLTASSTTGVGLSGSVVKDEVTGDFMIQAGAYSKASGDFLILEEFDKKQNKADFGILNEGMTKYKFTIAKANKYRQFKAHTCIIMVANPIGKNFNMAESLLPQINISGDLLSRFSFISAVTKPKIEDEYKINEIMIKTMSEKLKQEDKQNAEYLKKCLKVASENIVSMENKQILEQLNHFTTLTRQIAEKTTEESDGKFWGDITQRHQKSYIVMIRGIAMWHCHSIPTTEDIREARELYFSFLKVFLEHPNLLNITEIESGQTMEQIKQEIDEKMESMKWDAKKEEMISHKKSKREMFIEKMSIMQELSSDKLVDVIELQSWAMKELQLSETEFEDLFRKMKSEGIFYEPKAGWVHKI